VLGAFYFYDPRLDLVPAEHIAADGIDADFEVRLAKRPGWTSDHVDVLERGIALYWDRYDELARGASYLSPPRLRCVGVVRKPETVRPYAQILNECTCTLSLDDLDPTRSNPEFVAYVLAYGERAADTGDILRVPIHLAPWWFDRTDAERDAFCTAAEQSTRPDASLFRAIADAIPWLRELRHRRLRPVRKGGRHREIPGTGLLVPRRYESAPDALIGRVQNAAESTLRAFHAQHAGGAGPVLDQLVDWLGDAAPRVLVTDAGGRFLWDPERASETDALRTRLSRAGSEILASIRDDLECIDERSRRFLGSVREPAALPKPDAETAQGGYSFLHHERSQIAYNVDETGIERLLAPGIPYARAMLGARTLHEWGHLAVDAGWVPRAVDDSVWANLRAALAEPLEEIIRELPKPVRQIAAADLARLAREGSAGQHLVDIFESRLPDFQANILAARYQSDAEREAYVRQNIRPLRKEYPASDVLRMLVRYVYELQYLGFSGIEDPRTYFYEMTWFEADFFDTGILDEDRLDALSDAARALCRAHEIDEDKFVGLPDPT